VPRRTCPGFTRRRASFHFLDPQPLSNRWLVKLNFGVFLDDIHHPPSRDTDGFLIGAQTNPRPSSRPSPPPTKSFFLPSFSLVQPLGVNQAWDQNDSPSHGPSTQRHLPPEPPFATAARVIPQLVLLSPYTNGMLHPPSPPFPPIAIRRPSFYVRRG